MDNNATMLILMILVIAQILLYVMAFTSYFQVKDRRGPPGRGTCAYE